MKRKKRKSKLKAERLSVINRRIWNLVRNKVLSIHNHKCIVCGCPEPLDIHHLVPREVTPLRYDIDNLVPLCKSHHKFSRVLSAHKNSVAFILWFQEQFGESKLKILLKKALLPKINLKDREILYQIENSLK